MKSMIDDYGKTNNYIVKEHENGERRISYDLTGENSLTLDEDLAGLDRAYNKRLANLAGYIDMEEMMQMREVILKLQRIFSIHPHLHCAIKIQYCIFKRFINGKCILCTI